MSRNTPAKVGQLQKGGNISAILLKQSFAAVTLDEDGFWHGGLRRREVQEEEGEESTEGLETTVRPHSGLVCQKIVQNLLIFES